MSYREVGDIVSLAFRWVLHCWIFALTAASANAATYYVRNGGSDSADGLSHDSAWASLEKIKSHDFMPGDRVLFLEGNRWQGQLIVDWSGTADAPAIVAAYHLENGVPVRGYRARRPIIDGADAVPQQFDGLIRVRGDRVRVEGLAVINSEGRGIQYEDSDFGAVIDCMTDNSYKSGIKILRSHNALVQENVVTRAGVASPEDGGAWGGAIELVASNGGTVRRNLVAEVYGEGINSNHGSTGATIEGNYVFGARAVGIYVDAAPATTVRRNTVIGTANPDFWRSARSSGAGIAINNERYHYAANGGELSLDVQSRGTKIYGNLVAFATSGVGFWGQLDETTFDNSLVFNNTLVDNETQLLLQGKPKPGAKLINNILLSVSPGTRDVDQSSAAGVTARNNYFSQGDPGGDLSHAGNIYAGLTLARMSGWRGITGADQLSWRDFEIRKGSSVIGAGDDEPRRMSQGDDTFGLDFNALAHNAPMDIGAIRYSEVPVRTPRRPTGVRVRP